MVCFWYAYNETLDTLSFLRPGPVHGPVRAVRLQYQRLFSRTYLQQVQYGCAQPYRCFKDQFMAPRDSRVPQTLACFYETVRVELRTQTSRRRINITESLLPLHMRRVFDSFLAALTVVVVVLRPHRARGPRQPSLALPLRVCRDKTRHDEALRLPMSLQTRRHSYSYTNLSRQTRISTRVARRLEDRPFCIDSTQPNTTQPIAPFVFSSALALPPLILEPMERRASRTPRSALSHLRGYIHILFRWTTASSARSPSCMR